MSRQRGFWSSLFGGVERERFSVEELQHLHTQLLRNQVVTDANRDTVVEALRSIAELVIWGDQHDSGMVEYFLTENLLSHFNRILQQRSNRRGNVATQVLQTLSILIQNVRNQQTVYYLFSNNHINEIVSMRFDFDDDEVLGYYVNLLKTISLKLNEVTVQFFFQQLPGGSASFPLYTEAVKFVNHRDGMVRTAVKTLTLNVYAIPLPAVQRFVTQRPACGYLEELGAYVAEQCQVLDRLLSGWDVTSPQSATSLESCLAEIEDLLSYCNDVLATGVPALRELLLECLWRCFVGPVIFWPLIQDDVAAQHIAALSLGPGRPGVGSAAGGTHAAAGRSQSPRPAAPLHVERGIVGPLCSLYVLERLLHAVTDQPFLSSILAALLGGQVAAGGPSLSSPASSCPGSAGGSQPASRPGSPFGLQQPASPAGTAADSSGESGHESRPVSPPAAAVGGACGLPLPAPLLARLQYSPSAYRQAFLAMLRGGDLLLAGAALRVLAALVRGRAAVGEDLLEMLGLLPRRRRRQRQLLEALIATPSASFTANSRPGAAPEGDAADIPKAAESVLVAAAAAAAAAIAETPASERASEASTPQPPCSKGDGSNSSSSSRPLASPPAATGQGSPTANGVVDSLPLPGANGAGEAGHGGGISSSAGGLLPGRDGPNMPLTAVLEGAELGVAAAEQQGLVHTGSAQQRPHWSPGDETPISLAPSSAIPALAAAAAECGPAPGAAAMAAAAPTSFSSSHIHHDLHHHHQQEQQSLQQGKAAAAYGDMQFAELVAALLGLLGCDLLPPLSLLTLGWLLHQLLSVGVAGAELALPQAALVAAAVRHAQLAVGEHLEGPWCDVLGPIVVMEWGRARQAVLRTGAGSVHVAVHTWMQGVLAQELRWQLAERAAAGEGGSAPATPVSPAAGTAAAAPPSAAAAAKLAYLACLTLVAHTQISCLLLEGSVPAEPPMALPPGGTVGAPPPPPAAEVAERSLVRLSQQLSCVVAFARGQERKVYFSVEGLPGYVAAGAVDSVPAAAAPQQQQQQRPGGGGSNGGGEPGHLAAPAPGRHASSPPPLARVKPEALAAAVAASAPAVVVADPGSAPSTGVVLSAAPLFGAAPRVDDQHSRWLHVTVRPTARALYKVLATSHPGNALLNLERQLQAGHWVLAFPAADRAQAAQQLVEESARSMRALHRQLLLPLLGGAAWGAAERALQRA